MASTIASLGFVGAGRMATAMTRGFLAAGLVSGENITASATSRKSLDKIEEYGINVTTCNQEVVSRSQVVWLAVKPHAMGRVLSEIKPVVTDDHLFVSLAAGITLKSLEKVLCKVVRCMPNTPVIVRNGVCVYSPGRNINGKDTQLVEHMLNSVGIGFEMQEYYMDIMTALTGGGPTYMYMMLDALADGGVYAGVPKDVALKLLAHTMMGAAKMVLENGMHPQQLKDDVCSPAGTSIQAVRILEREGFRGIMMDAVHAASKRALELSRLENGEEKDHYVKR